ncbi:MAG: antibiotic biosynthesis monooxygenase [Pseudomonadota bacterium]
MITITAILTAKPGKADLVEQALLEVAAYVAANEAETVSFYIAKGLENDHLFTTYERFSSVEARDAHNSSPATAAFFEQAGPHIEQPVILESCTEISAKP